MSSSNKTAFAQLNQWAADDQPLRVDFNADNLKIDEALADCDKRLESRRLTGEAALFSQWYTSIGRTFYHRPPSVTHSFADDFSKSAHVDFGKTTACSDTYANRLVFSTTQNYPSISATGAIAPPSLISVFHMPGDGKLNYIVGPVQRKNSDATSMKLEFNIYRLDQSHKPVELISTKSATLSSPPAGVNTMTVNCNIDLTAGLYGIQTNAPIETRPSGTATASTLIGGAQALTTGRTPTYIFEGIGVKGEPLTGQYNPGIFYTLNNPTDRTVVTKPLDAGYPVKSIGLYAQHTGLTGLLSASVLLPDGTRVPLMRDADFSALDAAVERFTGDLPASESLAVEFILKGTAAPASRLLGWFAVLS